jgi:putative FmdB family regulatory protein
VVIIGSYPFCASTENAARHPARICTCPGWAASKSISATATGAINATQRAMDEPDMLCIPILKQNVNALHISFCVNHLTKWQSTPPTSTSLLGEAELQAEQNRDAPLAVSLADNQLHWRRRLPKLVLEFFMPTYEYVCSKCERHFEIHQPITANALTICPKDLCPRKTWGKGKVKRVLSMGGGLIFKGSGFYETDYRSEGYKAAAKKDAAASSSSASTSTDSAKKESKPTEAAKPKPSGDGGSTPAKSK